MACSMTRCSLFPHALFFWQAWSHIALWFLRCQSGVLLYICMVVVEVICEILKSNLGSPCTTLALKVLPIKEQYLCTGQPSEISTVH